MIDISSELDSFLSSNNDLESLSFLGLTTKVENPFRDQFAYYLYKKYHKKSNIAREYSNGQNLRVDLAIIEKNSKIFVEFKACYSFDLLKLTNNLYQREILKDKNKYKDLINKTKMSFVLLSIRTGSIPEVKYKDFIKYYISLRNSFKTLDTEKQKDLSYINVNSWFDGSNGLIVKSSGSHYLGISYEVKVFIDYFVIENSQMLE